MKYLLLVMFFSSLNWFCIAQRGLNNKDANSIFVEVGGHSRSLYSVNYEHVFSTKFKYIYFTSRIGIGYTPGAGNRDKGTYSKPGVTVPIVFFTLLGRNSHFAQLGIGYTPSFGETFTGVKSTGPVVHMAYESAFSTSLGYRFVDVGGVTAQIFQTAIWTNNPSQKFGYIIGMGIGWNWR
jgi:hypothetical protein